MYSVFVHSSCTKLIVAMMAVNVTFLNYIQLTPIFIVSVAGRASFLSGDCGPHCRALSLSLYEA